MEFTNIIKMKLVMPIPCHMDHTLLYKKKHLIIWNRESAYSNCPFDFDRGACCKRIRSFKLPSHWASLTSHTWKDVCIQVLVYKKSIKNWSRRPSYSASKDCYVTSVRSMAFLSEKKLRLRASASRFVKLKTTFQAPCLDSHHSSSRGKHGGPPRTFRIEPNGPFS